MRRPWVVGPRMQTGAHSLGITGGHCDENAYWLGVSDEPEGLLPSVGAIRRRGESWRGNWRKRSLAPRGAFAAEK